MNKELIIKTIRWFDLFDYPLTPWEIWKYLWLEKVEYGEILEALEAGSIEGLENRHGFYFLSGRAEIIKTRQQRYYFTDLKFKRAVRVAKILKIIPWIKMIAVGNIIGAHNLKESGDIDFFIIAEKGKIWLTRFAAVVAVKFLFLRPSAGKQKDKICLSFFVDEKNMDLSGLMLDLTPDKSNFTVGQSNLTPRPPLLNRREGEDAAEKTSNVLWGRWTSRAEDIDDPYFIHWLAGLVPIYDPFGYYEKFIEANKYVYDFLPNWRPGGLNFNRDAGRACPQWWQKANNFIFGRFVNILKKLQIKKFPPRIKELLNKDTRVMANDGVIKLHVNDRREVYRNFLGSK